MKNSELDLSIRLGANFIRKNDNGSCLIKLPLKNDSSYYILDRGNSKTILKTNEINNFTCSMPRIVGGILIFEYFNLAGFISFITNVSSLEESGFLISDMPFWPKNPNQSSPELLNLIKKYEYTRNIYNLLWSDIDDSIQYQKIKRDAIRN